MDANTIISAPSTGDATALFDRWKLTHSGKLSDFLRFLSTPSMERDVFLDSCNRSIVVNRAAIVIYS